MAGIPQVLGYQKLSQYEDTQETLSVETSIDQQHLQTNDAVRKKPPPPPVPKRKSPRLVKQQVRRNAYIKPELRDMVSTWNDISFKSALVKCVPYLVGLVWGDGLTDLSKISKLPILALLKSGTSTREVEGNGTIWEKLFACFLYQRDTFNTSQLVIALAYVRRLKEYHNSRDGTGLQTFFDRQAYHETNQFEYAVFLVSMVMANKYCEDQAYNNVAWAKMTGIGVHIINQLERDALTVLEHDLFFGPQEFGDWLSCVQSILAVPTPRRPSR